MVSTMTTQIDDALAVLRDAPADRRLDQLEPAVWARIDRRRGEAAGAGSFRLQLAVAAGALVVGVAFAHVTVRPKPPSEAVLLSEDAGLAPSIRLAGGA
jgi:hypothetical protein